jgi:hypothetical protein
MNPDHTTPSYFLEISINNICRFCRLCIINVWKIYIFVLVLFFWLSRQKPVTCIPIAKQRFGKKASTIERMFPMGSVPQPLLCNCSVKTFQQQRLCFLSGPCRGFILKTIDGIRQLSVQLRSVNQRATEAEECPLLRFVTRKRLVKTRQRDNHCGELLLSNDSWKVSYMLWPSQNKWQRNISL